MSSEKRDEQIFKLLGIDNNLKKYPEKKEDKISQFLKIEISCLMKGEVLFELSISEEERQKYITHARNLREVTIFCKIHDLILSDDVLAIIKTKLELNQDGQSFSIPYLIQEELTPSAIHSFLNQVNFELSSVNQKQ
jgi:hypothetical protein